MFGGRDCVEATNVCRNPGVLGNHFRNCAATLGKRSCSNEGAEIVFEIGQKQQVKSFQGGEIEQKQKLASLPPDVKAFQGGKRFRNPGLGSLEQSNAKETRHILPPQNRAETRVLSSELNAKPSSGPPQINAVTTPGSPTRPTRRPNRRPSRPLAPRRLAANQAANQAASP